MSRWTRPFPFVMRDAADSGSGGAVVKAPQPAAGANSIAMVRTMGIVATLSGLLIVGSFQLTAEKIRQNRVDQLRGAVLAVVPGATQMRVFEMSDTGLTALDEVPATPGRQCYAGYDEQGEFKGVAVPTSGMGFADIIRVLYGVDPRSSRVIGYTVLETKETPGLGDKIMKNTGFLANFEGLDVSLNEQGTALEHPVEIVKPGQKTEDWQIDTITGATISSKAVGRMMQASTARDLPLLVRSLEALEGGAR